MAIIRVLSAPLFSRTLRRRLEKKYLKKTEIVSNLFEVFLVCLKYFHLAVHTCTESYVDIVVALKGRLHNTSVLPWQNRPCCTSTEVHWKMKVLKNWPRKLPPPRKVSLSAPFTLPLFLSFFLSPFPCFRQSQFRRKFIAAKKDLLLFSPPPPLFSPPLSDICFNSPLPFLPTSFESKRGKKSPRTYQPKR